MNPDSKNFPTPEKRNPTSQDLQDLINKANNLSRGDLVHDINNLLNGLTALVELSKKTKEWNREHLQLWYKKVGELNKIITQANIDKAKEEGL